MADKKTVSDLVEAYLDGSEMFLVHAKVTPQNRIMVFIDGDKGVTIEDCTRLSRHLEQQLDRDTEDFELHVSSVGVDQPLVFLRQYQKNAGRRLAVTGNDGSVTTGRLETVTEEGIHIERDAPSKGKKKAQKDVPAGGGKVFIPFAGIREAKVLVSFKKK